MLASWIPLSWKIESSLLPFTFEVACMYPQSLGELKHVRLFSTKTGQRDWNNLKTSFKARDLCCIPQMWWHLTLNWPCWPNLINWCWYKQQSHFKNIKSHEIYWHLTVVLVDSSDYSNQTYSVKLNPNSVYNVKICPPLFKGYSS